MISRPLLYQNISISENNLDNSTTLKRICQQKNNKNKEFLCENIKKRLLEVGVKS